MKKLLMILGTAAALLTLGANGLEEGFLSPTGRHTFTTWKHWTKDDAPLPSGLLGPVVFRFEKAGTRQVERVAPAADFTLEKSGVRATIDGDGRIVRLVNTATGHDSTRSSGSSGNSNTPTIRPPTALP